MPLLNAPSGSMASASAKSSNEKKMSDSGRQRASLGMERTGKP